MLEYKLEKFSQIWPDMAPLLPDHFAEVASLPEKNLDVDVGKFFAAEANHCLLCASARDQGQLVGYMIDFITIHPHYKAIRVASADAYYIKPAYRARCAMGLTRFMEKSERDLGVYMRVTRVKKTNNAGKFFKAMGYAHIEEVLGKRL